LEKIGKNKTVIISVVIALIAAVAIGMYIRVPRSPGGTVSRFYREISNGDFESASEYVIEEDVETFKDSMIIGDTEEMEKAMQQTSINVNILNEDVRNGEATVEAEITVTMENPMTEEEIEETMQEEFELIQENGEWKIIYT